ncbi:MAG: catalase [Paracoccus denitrificans]|nr:MAG: catalase [Paracoccus denitrificans]PZO84856.1 MAG: catalase [Paracoccus denitrificans]
MQQPVPYTPDLETPKPDEREVIDGLQAALAEIMTITATDSGRAMRSVHAKVHAYLVGTLTIASNLPPELAQGLFARPGAHPAILRVSTNPGDILPDAVSLPRGIGLKVLDVEGARLPGAEGQSQDFLMVNGPVFTAATPDKFLSNLKLLAKTTDRVEWAKVALSRVLRGTEKALEAVGGSSTTLQSLGGAPNVHPLGETYFTQVPFRHGDFVAKYSLKPVSESLTQFTGVEIDARGKPDAIREAMDFDTQKARMTWELRVQLLRNPDTMPVEDPSVAWPEAESPWQIVATLTVEAQPSFDDKRARLADDKLRFSAWTGLAAHQPLGAINRARRDAYEMSASFRSRFNRCPIHEPQDAGIADQS